MQRKKEALYEAIANHLREFLSSRPPTPLVTAECSPEFSNMLNSYYGRDAVTHSPPSGARHPFDLDTTRTVARESLAAALLADHLIQQYRWRSNKTYVPIDAKKAYIDFALDIYRKASWHTVKERIRLRKKDIYAGGLDYEDEGEKPTGELAPANHELELAISISASSNNLDVEEESVRAIMIMFEKFAEGPPSRR